MICRKCIDVFTAYSGRVKCKKNGMLINMRLYSKKWEDPRCPELAEYNASILQALKGFTYGH